MFRPGGGRAVLLVAGYEYTAILKLPGCGGRARGVSFTRLMHAVHPAFNGFHAKHEYPGYGQRYHHQPQEELHVADTSKIAGVYARQLVGRGVG